VENAFKHGKLNDPDHPLIISLLTDENQMQFCIKNKKSNDVKEKSSGIGLSNIRKRLELAYPDAHEIKIENNNDDFMVSLKLILEP
jgi:LytS/YehU family sensor histidine kinase